MRSLRVSVFLALRSMARGNYGIAAATTLMMLLIYLSLLFLPSLIQGAIDRVNTQLVDTLTSNVVITAGDGAGSIEDAGAYLAKIRGTDGVAAATPVRHVGTQVAYGDDAGSFSVDAIDPASYGDVFTTPANVIEGRALTGGDGDQVMLGIGVAGADHTGVRGYRASLKSVHAGDGVTVTLADGKPAAFTVAGVYDDQFPQADDDAYVTMTEAQRLLPGIADQATDIYVRATPHTDVGQLISRLSGLRDGMTFQTAADLGASVQDQTASYRLISNILKVVSLLMAAITIFTITYVDLANKRRQIGIERAIGIRSGPIVFSYVLKAWAYALVGIGAGAVVFRFGVTRFVRHHPFHFPNGPVTLATTWGELVRDLVILLIVATLAAIVPAWRSVRIRILDAIWGT